MNNKKIFLSTFILVFFAELGDKTQIASFSLAARYSQLSPVIIGASTAFVCSSLLAVFLGHKISTIVPQKRIKLVCGILFILTGIYMLIRNLL